MAIIDDLKKKTEEGLKTLKETAQDLAFNVEKQAKISKMKYVDITKLQRNIQKTYTEIGEYVYDQLTSGKTVNKEARFLQEKMASITRMNLDIADLETEMNEIQGTHPPKHNLD
jgi:hypothetical protein